MLQRVFRKLWTRYLFFYYLSHMKTRKLLFGAFLGMFALAWVAILPNSAFAARGTLWSKTAAIGESEQWDNPTWKDMIYDREQTWSQIMTTIKSTIQWILWFLATIAVVICLYGGFLMMTAAGDEKKYQKGLTVLKYAAIGLAVIALSWIIVSAIFWFVNLQWWSGNTMWEGSKG